MDADEAVRRLEELANPASVAGMARYGINPEKTLGVKVPDLRRLAREAGRDHELALGLWATGIHEARILAGMVEEPSEFTEEQAEEWVAGLDSWDVCDQLAMNLLDRTPFAVEKALEWSEREPEFVKRAGFAVMARLAWTGKQPDEVFERFLEAVERECADERNFVKKALSWALRQIGKRNAHLNGEAVKAARRIAKLDSKAARWVAADALKELNSGKVRERLGLDG